MAVALAAAEPDLQLRSAAASAAASAASAASAAASGDADLPGRLGDPGYGSVPTAASAASAAAASAGAGTRLSQGWLEAKVAPGSLPPRGFFLRIAGAVGAA